MSETQDEIPPPPPPPATQQTPTQQTPHTVSTIKLPILKKGEYDIWAMKMEHYLAHTDYPIWEVIQNGNGPVSVTTDTIIIQNGTWSDQYRRMILASVEKDHFVWPSITEDGVTRLKEYVELTPTEAIQADCDIKAIKNHLQGPTN
ncbi:hypothetical protein Tco_0601161 [Tanacetum coccineum]